MALVAVGHIQDDAQQAFFQVAEYEGCDHLIINASDCARLLLAYGKICSQDGTRFTDGTCGHGHAQGPRLEVNVRVQDGFEYEVAEVEDVSLASARRLRARILANRDYSREVLREIIRDATREIARSTYCRNDLVAKRLAGSEAQVVWLYLAGDLQDLRNCNWLARSQWIDPTLAYDIRPMELEATEQIDGIGVVWSEGYQVFRKFNREHTAGKGEFLRKLEPLLERARLVGDQVCTWFYKFETGQIDERGLTARIRGASGEIDALVQEQGDLPLAPHDVWDYDARAASLFTWLGNMAIFYSERGAETWPEENRTYLMKCTVQDFRSDLERLAFEREKLH